MSKHVAVVAMRKGQKSLFQTGVCKKAAVDKVLNAEVILAQWLAECNLVFVLYYHNAGVIFWE